jgi:hypothetical protein
MTATLSRFHQIIKGSVYGQLAVDPRMDSERSLKIMGLVAIAHFKQQVLIATLSKFQLNVVIFQTEIKTLQYVMLIVIFQNFLKVMMMTRKKIKMLLIMMMTRMTIKMMLIKRRKEKSL